MENFKKENANTFKPGKIFIEHIDEKHEESLEKRGIDLAYQREFGDFFLNVFKEAKIDIPYSITFCLEEALDAYCSLSLCIHRAVVPNNPCERMLLDTKIQESFHKEWHRILSNKKLNKIITQAYVKKVDFDKLLSLMEIETDQAKKNLLLLIIQIINPHAIPKTENEVEVKMTESSFTIGGCEMAEKNMLAYISGKHTKPKDGYVNLIIDNNKSPLMLEKMHLGNKHSALSLKPVRINGVLIPAGAILSAEPDIFEPTISKMKLFPKKEGAINYVTKLSDYKGFKFIRMSILSLPEEIRASAGGDTYLHQQNRTIGYINYDWLTPPIIAEYASHRFKKEQYF